MSAKHPRPVVGILAPVLVGPAVRAAFVKLDPRVLISNPVMFVVEIVSVLATFALAREIVAGGSAGLMAPSAGWLWCTVLFANFAEALAEGRGKARADSLRATHQETAAKRLASPDARKTETVPSSELRTDDIVLVEAGDIIPADGDIIEGIASVDESAITGESAPVIRESGGDRSAVTGGTRVVSDWIKVRITARPGESFLDRMIARVEGARRQKTPNEIALNILLVGMTLIFLIVVVTLEPFAVYAGTTLPVIFLIALLVTLIPTTIGGLLSAIGIAGMDAWCRPISSPNRAAPSRRRATSTRSDRQDRHHHLRQPHGRRLRAGEGVAVQELAEAAALASLSDDTPEGRSIVELAKNRHGFTADAAKVKKFIPFTAQTRMSGAELDDGEVRKGAEDAILAHAEGAETADLKRIVEEIARSGGTPLLVARDRRILGVVHLKDIVKPDIALRFAELRRMGIRTVMITGDNPLTAAAIAAEAGWTTSWPKPRRKRSWNGSARSRPGAAWSPCAVTAPTTRPPSPRPTSASP
jgi:K+-transporting ATPase ATPase B chain